MLNHRRMARMRKTTVHVRLESRDMSSGIKYSMRPNITDPGMKHSTSPHQEYTMHSKETMEGSSGMTTTLLRWPAPASLCA
jgi:hypothetical protein